MEGDDMEKYERGWRDVEGKNKGERMESRIT